MESQSRGCAKTSILTVYPQNSTTKKQEKKIIQLYYWRNGKAWIERLCPEHCLGESATVLDYSKVIKGCGNGNTAECTIMDAA